MMRKSTSKARSTTILKIRNKQGEGEKHGQ